jgi:hypothetical protein
MLSRQSMVLMSILDEMGRESMRGFDTLPLIPASEPPHAFAATWSRGWICRGKPRKHGTRSPWKPRLTLEALALKDYRKRQFNY